MLKDESYLLQSQVTESIRRKITNCFCTNTHSSSGRVPDTSQNLKKCALSAARWTHHQQNFTVMDIKRNVPDGVHGCSPRPINDRDIRNSCRKPRKLGHVFHRGYRNMLAGSARRTRLIGISDAPAHMLSVINTIITIRENGRIRATELCRLSATRTTLTAVPMA